MKTRNGVSARKDAAAGKNGQKKKPQKKMPLALMIALDLLLTAGIMLTFSYFHHVRMLWGIGQKTEVLENFDSTVSSRNSSPESAETQPHEHSFSVKEVIAPTCEEEGFTIYVCACGEEKKGDVTPAAGHSDFYTEGQTEATFESAGYTGDVYCGVCKKLVEPGTEIPAKVHLDRVLVNEKPATCEEDGYTGDWFCNDEGCGKIVAEGSVIPKLGHVFTVFKVIKPTCSTGGYTLKHCERCGKEMRTDLTGPVAHAYGKDGKCIYCGAAKVDYSGDFGSTLADKFLGSSGTAVHLKDDREIRAYAAANGLPLAQTENSVYLSLYRSHDVYMTVREVSGTVPYVSGTQTKNVKVRYFDYDVYVRNLKNIFTEIPSDYSAQMDALVEQAEKRTGATVLAAVNGDYFGNKNLCKIAVRNGKLLRLNDSPFKNDILVLFYDGTMQIYTKATYNWEEISKKRPYQIWQFGPGLYGEDGSPRKSGDFDSEIYDESVIGSQHPRTAIGYYEPGHYALISADGRNVPIKVYGLYLSQLGQIAKSLGCKIAYNLDGGDSSQAYLDGKLIRYDVSRVKRGENQRNLCDIICVCDWPS